MQPQGNQQHMRLQLDSPQYDSMVHTERLDTQGQHYLYKC